MSQIEGGSPLQQARDAWARRDIWGARTLIERVTETGPIGSDLARTRLLAGVIYREIGDSALALKYLTTLMNEWDAYPGDRTLLEGSAWYNLALVYLQLRRPLKATDAYRKAIVEFRREGMRVHLRMALQNLAWTLAEIGNAEEAVQTADQVRAERLIDQGDMDAEYRQRVVAAYCAYADSDYRGALELTGDVTRHADAKSDVRANAYFIAGLAAVAVFDLEDAEKLADAAMNESLVAVDPRCMNDAGRLKRLVAEAKAKQGV